MISDNTIIIEPRLGEARVTLANNNKLRRVMGWKPSVKLDEWVKNEMERIK